MTQSEGCPNCGSGDTCRILYGVVDYDEELQRKEAEGKVWIPGCLVEFDSEGRKLNRHCNACDNSFVA